MLEEKIKLMSYLEKIKIDTIGENHYEIYLKDDNVLGSVVAIIKDGKITYALDFRGTEVYDTVAEIDMKQLTRLQTIIEELINFKF